MSHRFARVDPGLVVTAAQTRTVEALQEPVRFGRRRAWRLAACVVLIAGLLGSAGLALLWRSARLGDARHSFESSASSVTATLGTLIRRDADFVAMVRAVATMEPRLTETRFQSWFDTLQGGQREVGSLGTSIVASVPAAQLAAFLARRDANGGFTRLLGRKPELFAGGRRARYCLLAAGSTIVPFSSSTAQILQGDWCLPSSPIGALQAPANQAATDSGEFVVLPVRSDGLRTTFLEAAYYRRDLPSATIAERRVAVAGWALSSFDLPALIRTAIGDNRGLAVLLYHRDPGEHSLLLGHVGDARLGGLARATTLSIDGTWTVEVYVRPIGAALSADAQGILVFLAGATVSVLLFLLVLLLARSREQALGLVEEKAGQLRHQALHDALTGLPNRVLALDRAEQLLARARRARVPAAALYVDIDGLRHVNETFGRDAGDEVLRIVAGRLMSVIREADSAARVAGDEFVVLLEGSSLDVGPELVAERLLEVLREPYDLNGKSGRSTSLTASIGVAHGMDGSAEALLADADIALYVAKASGKDRSVVFESGMQTAARDRLTLELDLADALAADELFVVYQPTFDLQSERATGVEALLRWRHPIRGLIPPDVFVSLAEDSGQIVSIGRWVLQQACVQGARWRANGHALRIAVNVSGRQLDRDELIDDVRGALDSSGLCPAALTLEITETALMSDAEESARRLSALKQLGVRISIDDFGTGYSSLAYLRRFPVDELKIDRSFVNGVADSQESAALVNTLVRLGKSLNLETLAEGIENREQLSALQRHGCDYGQGYLFSLPLDASAVEEFLEQSGNEALMSSR